MPRAFLITRRRYNGTGEFEEIGREYSPERGVRLAEYGGGQQPTSDGASECGSESSSECPEELYNLTKLAEVSLAAAAGTLVHPASGMYQRPAALLAPPPPPPPPPQQQQQQPPPPPLFFDANENQQLHELKSCRRAGQRQRFPAPFNQNGMPRHMTMDIVATPSQQNPLDGQQAQDGTEEHECPDCGKKYSTSSNLARHRQTHRSLGDKKARRCPHCDKVYVSIPAFSMHVRTHNQGCKCNFCGKCFSRPWLLQGHIRTHTGEKPFKCTICNKAFADKSNLRAHIQTHSNTKPHVCARCGKAFALKSYLYKHEESSCMRSQHQKRETSLSPSTSSSSSSSSSSCSPRTILSSSHPTSVIVPPRANLQTAPQQQQPNPNSSFSAIIRHTDTEQEAEAQRNRDLLSRMVIRTSVISPNPEHLAARKIAAPQPQQPANHHQVFDFNDPQRVSAFSRPQSMTLNLAIA